MTRNRATVVISQFYLSFTYKFQPFFPLLLCCLLWICFGYCFIIFIMSLYYFSLFSLFLHFLIWYAKSNMTLINPTLLIEHNSRTRAQPFKKHFTTLMSRNIHVALATCMRQHDKSRAPLYLSQPSDMSFRSPFYIGGLQHQNICSGPSSPLRLRPVVDIGYGGDAPTLK